MTTPRKYYVKLYPNGKICIYGNPEGTHKEVELSEEDIIVLSHLDGKFFRLIDKFVQAGFELGRESGKEIDHG